MKRISERASTKRESDLSLISTIVPGLNLPVELNTHKAKKRNTDGTEEKQSSSPKARDYAREKLLAMEKSVDRIAVLREERDSGVLGEEIIKLAQALILCTLPYRPTKERQIVRSARLSDGSKLTVTFSAALNDIEMPFGADVFAVWLALSSVLSDPARIQAKQSFCP